MYIQYLCKTPQTVADQGEEYIFNCDEIKEIPDKLAKYLLQKQSASFRRARKPEIKKAEKIIDNPIISYIMYFKRASENAFKIMNEASPDVKCGI